MPDVVHLAPDKAVDLTASLRRMPGIVFEAHSDDDQTVSGLTALVRGGLASLKIGPWQRFALRLAPYALDSMADVLDGPPRLAA